MTAGSVAGARSPSRAPISSRPRSTKSSNRRRSSSAGSPPAGAGAAGAGAAAGRPARGVAVAPVRSAAASVVDGSVPTPSPAAHRPHSAELNETTSPGLGWLVARLSTSSPSTSEAKPCSARLGPTSTKTRAPCVIERAQALDELDRRGDLPREDVEHLLLDVVAGRVQLAVDVGHDRQLRGLQAQPLQRRAQRRARRRDDLGVEGVADRQRDRLVAALLQRGHDPADGLRRAAEHDLVGRVDVGEHDVAVARRDDLLDLGQRRHDGGHRPGVLDVEARHLAPAGADRLERGLERERAGGHERAVLAQRVAHDEVGSDPVLAQQAREGHVDGEHGGLGDLGRPQLLLGPRHRRGVGGIGEDDVRQPPALQQRGHDLVGPVEHLGDRPARGARSSASMLAYCEPWPV